MTLRIFLDYCARTKTLPQGTVFCFSGREYPLLFFYHLISFFKKNHSIIEYLNCVGVDVSSIKALLATMSFSGRTTYWLEGFYMLPAKKQQELIEYLRVYSGPHRVLLFSDTLAPDSSTTFSATGINTIVLPDTIAPQDFPMVRFLVSEASCDKSNFASQIGMYADHLSLDSICLFAHYELVLGKSMDEFFQQWITRIIDPTSSLFVLSQHFFSKKSKSFFRQWATSSELYMPTFWATYWADQVWRAYVFCDLMKQKKYPEAKKAQYKLPFSFINRDWSSYSLTELHNAHLFLSNMDFRLKNGNSEIGLEHFYGQFFENKFR